MKHIHSNILQDALLTEHKTVAAMMAIYCRDKHGSHGELCDECKALLEYAEVRLDRCPYGQNKPACNKCPIHCYKPEPKATMKAVMRYSGPRMLLSHPILSIRHIRLVRMPVPDKPAQNVSNRHLRKQTKN